jgi:hypothetical protein
MLVFLLIFALGIGVGFFVRSKNRVMRMATGSLDLIIYLLLFSLGAKIGIDHELISKLGSLGVDALLLTIGSVFGSILVLLPVKRLFTGVADEN